MRRLCACLLILLPAPLLADTDGEPDMRLTVKPVLCITDNRTPRCDLAFIVAWESEASGYYCLFNDFGESPLGCWSDERNGSLNDERSVVESFNYWMTDAVTDNRLALVAVEVLRMDTDDRRRKRRTRHVWDIN